MIKIFKKDDKKGLKCSISGCDFITSATKKARKQIRKHEEKHKKEKTIIAENTNTIDSQATRMSDSQMADDGSLLDDTGEGGHILSWGWPVDHKTTCALCGTSFPTIDLMEYDDIYCPDGCPEEALERSANSGQPDSQGEMSDSQMPDALEIRQDYNAIRANIVINDETKLEHHKIKN